MCWYDGGSYSEDEEDLEYLEDEPVYLEEINNTCIVCGNPLFGTAIFCSLDCEVSLQSLWEMCWNDIDEEDLL